jgi:hypothetical protein
MLIRVMYDDGKFDMVKPQMLDLLLGTGKLTSFKRSDSWAVVGRDTLRSRIHSSQGYAAPERRACLA